MHAAQDARCAVLSEHLKQPEESQAEPIILRACFYCLHPRESYLLPQAQSQYHQETETGTSGLSADALTWLGKSQSTQALEHQNALPIIKSIHFSIGIKIDISNKIIYFSFLNLHNLQIYKTD